MVRGGLPMEVTRVLASRGLTGFYFDDQRAIKHGATPDGFAYTGAPETPGFHAVRQAGECVSVMLELSDGAVAYGDCAAIQYSGAGGRDPVFLASQFVPVVEGPIRDLLVGRQISQFRPLAEEVDALVEAGGRPLHTAIRYGVTQAILDAVARSSRRTMAQVIAQEYGTQVSTVPIPIFAQSGDDRYISADKMIIKGVGVLPHGLINNVETKLGSDGRILKAYVSWLRDRVVALGKPGYSPVFHIDVYGTIGLAFDNDFERIAAYMRELEEAAHPFHLRIEGPIDAEERHLQVTAMAELRRALRTQGVGVEIVADEWCNTLEDIRLLIEQEAADMIQIKTPVLGGINNTIEAVLMCKAAGVGAYLGGTCNETERSAQVCVHIALATCPAQMLAKPGMGVDEGLAIVYNEMHRALRLMEDGRS